MAAWATGPADMFEHIGRIYFDIDLFRLRQYRNGRSRCMHSALCLGFRYPLDTMSACFITKLRPYSGAFYVYYRLAKAAGLVKKTHDNVQFVLVGPLDNDSVDRLDSNELDEVQRSKYSGRLL